MATVLALSITVLIAALMATTTWLDIRRDQSICFGELEERADRLVEAVDDSITEPVAFSDLGQILILARIFENIPDLVTLQVVAPDGRALFDLVVSESGEGEGSSELAVRAIVEGRTLKERRGIFIEVAGPIEVDSHVVAAASFLYDTSDNAMQARQKAIQAIWQSAVLVAIGVVVSVLLARYFVRPIRRLVTATRRVAEGRFEYEASEHRYDEIGELSMAFGEMTSALAASRQELQDTNEALTDANLRLESAMDELEMSQQDAIQTERLKAVQEMASGVAHEVNNALSAVLGIARPLLNRPEQIQDPDRVRSDLETMATVARDGVQLVSELREFYRPRGAAEEFAETALDEVVRQAVSMTRHSWSGRPVGESIELTLDVDDSIPTIEANETGLRGAVANLIRNSVDALPEGGEIRVGTGSSAGTVRLTVADNGVGMDEETRRRCLEPFFTTKDVLGTGMGLAIVHGVARRHGGTVEVESEPGGGTTISMVLPVTGVNR